MAQTYPLVGISHIDVTATGSGNTALIAPTETHTNPEGLFQDTPRVIVSLVPA